MKIQVIYVTNVINNSLKFFCKYGYFDSNDIDFYICLNNLDLNIDEIITEKHNLFIISKENTGLDFGGWSYVLLKDDLYKKYDYYILINGSCTGPFVPLYEKEKWTNLLISQINEDDKLIGSTINYYWNNAHVQSYLLCFDKIIIEIAIKNEIFSNEINKDNNIDKIEYIIKYEIGFSKVVLDAGYNIKCLMKSLENIDFRKNRIYPVICLPYGNTDQLNSDIIYYNFDELISFYEIMFIKTGEIFGYSQKVDKYHNFYDRVKDNPKDKIY